MLTSVIIPTFNSCSVLKKTLPAILNQQLEPGFTLEVIVIIWLY